MFSKGSEGAFTGDSAPSEARKRGSGGGSPRKHDEFEGDENVQDEEDEDNEPDSTCEKLSALRISE